MVYSALGTLPFTNSTCTLPLVEIEVNSDRFLLCAVTKTERKRKTKIEKECLNMVFYFYGVLIKSKTNINIARLH